MTAAWPRRPRWPPGSPRSARRHRRQPAGALPADRGVDRPRPRRPADRARMSRVGECRYGDWTGQPLKKLAEEKLWRVVQAHPSAVTFPGPDGESMPEMQHRAVTAIRDWNARLGAGRHLPGLLSRRRHQGHRGRQPGPAPRSVPADPGRPLLADRDQVHAAAAVRAPDERPGRRGRGPPAPNRPTPVRGRRRGQRRSGRRRLRRGRARPRALSPDGHHESADTRG